MQGPNCRHPVHIRETSLFGYTRTDTYTATASAEKSLRARVAQSTSRGRRRISLKEGVDPRLGIRLRPITVRNLEPFLRQLAEVYLQCPRCWNRRTERIKREAVVNDLPSHSKVLEYPR